MCEINCPKRATHLIHAADHSGLSLQACEGHLDQAVKLVVDMATPGVEIKTTRM